MATKKGYCTVEFDGASKGNPGQSGSGAILKDESGNKLWSGHEGLGHSTGNQSQYRGAIKGLEKALEFGYDKVVVKGNSELFMNQVTDSWKTRSENLRGLNYRAKKLRDQFSDFKAERISPDLNRAADAEANKGVWLEKRELHDRYYY